jgi:hypothetical protein
MCDVKAKSLLCKRLIVGLRLSPDNFGQQLKIGSGNYAGQLFRVAKKGVNQFGRDCAVFHRSLRAAR